MQEVRFNSLQVHIHGRYSVQLGFEPESRCKKSDLTHCSSTCTADIQCSWVLNLEHSSSEAEALSLGHHVYLILLQIENMLPRWKKYYSYTTGAFSYTYTNDEFSV
ncbi:hypothetical protein AVEN_89969-1 [Araneus ventricosus]|uniref:Uncharacterized protein n=1 Tax=Araneus ventricosus TaxID=182803 RepID=A0A4Y2PUB6_ARAVE|nr:hypothetical protein AVEN_89969-1 [Araneus ventricosus]